LFGNSPQSLVALFYVMLGLNLLGIVNFQFPSYTDINGNKKAVVNLPESAEAFLFGATSALISSPCSSPILAALLAFVGTIANPLLGAIFLTFYSFGYVAITVIAGFLSSSAVSSLVKNSDNSSWITNLLSTILICYGTYNFLSSIIV
jgi:cytochrome c-type biogenesis protein